MTICWAALFLSGTFMCSLYVTTKVRSCAPVCVLPKAKRGEQMSHWSAWGHLKTLSTNSQFHDHIMVHVELHYSSQELLSCKCHNYPKTRARSCALACLSNQRKKEEDVNYEWSIDWLEDIKEGLQESVMTERAVPVGGGGELHGRFPREGSWRSKRRRGARWRPLPPPTRGAAACPRRRATRPGWLWSTSSGRRVAGAHGGTRDTRVVWDYVLLTLIPPWLMK